MVTQRLPKQTTPTQNLFHLFHIILFHNYLSPCCFSVLITHGWYWMPMVSRAPWDHISSPSSPSSLSEVTHYFILPPKLRFCFSVSTVFRLWHISLVFFSDRLYLSSCGLTTDVQRLDTHRRIFTFVTRVSSRECDSIKLDFEQRRILLSHTSNEYTVFDMVKVYLTGFHQNIYTVFWKISKQF